MRTAISWEGGGFEITPKFFLLAQGCINLCGMPCPAPPEPLAPNTASPQQLCRQLAMAKLLQRVVSDAATKVAARRGNATLPEMQRADTEPSQEAAVAAALEKINSSGADYREMLLRHVKREVKQLMEESVTRKCIHQECSIITSLCAGVENCLLYGLKRHSLGMFRDSSTLALLQKISRSCPAAKAVTERLQTGEASQTTSSSSSSSSSVKRPVQNVKFQWIRVALMDKQLAKIIEHLVENGRQFYETDSIIGDPCDGPLLASLLVGPCALEFDQSQGSGLEMCSDLSADEMLQRHRIHSPLRKAASSPKNARKPSLKLRRSQSPAGDAVNHRRSQAGGGMAEFVQLLHQNSRATLLFGKNNVLSQTPALPRKMPGYLSLHLEPCGLTVKWMPNLLMMAGGTSDSDASQSAPYPSPAASASGSDSGPSNPASPWQAAEAIDAPPWESALTIHVEDMVYIHCHSNQPVGCSLVFVAHDGTQKPPLQFPPGGHLLQFLTCLENGLLPGGALEPPLWSHRCKGKVLPRMKRRSILRDSFISGLVVSGEGDDATAKADQQPQPQSPEQQAADEAADSEPLAPSDFDDNMDFVFRIVTRESRHRAGTADADPVEEAGSVFSWQESYSSEALQSRLAQPAEPAERRQTIRQACDSMRRQILSRAFYGWLAHVRHMSCVRRHLPDLVTCRAGLGRREDYPEGLTPAVWEAGDPQEVWRALYWGGCSRPELRKKVWPVLLGFHSWEASEAERQLATESAQARFENLLSEWGPLDAIVRENDRELAASARDLMNARARSSAAPPSNGRSQLSVPGLAAEAPSAGDDTQEGSTPAVTSSLSHESIASTASQASNGGVYSSELIDSVTANWHRIDKDVDRCDRHVAFFTEPANLEKLRNIMCCYVWQNLSVGYIQGFCDLLAPMLMALEEEGLTLACFSLLMKRMVSNFPGAAENCASTESLMDQHLANLRATIQVADPQLFEHMLRRGDYTHFYFCYRWFLLEFKREFCYQDVCLIWETIWSASHLVSKHFNVFVAMALLREYRGVIIENDMDFTDIIKFYNEMAEHHRLSSVLESARDLADQLVKMVENH